MRKSRIVVVALAIVTASVALAASAQASYHGRNGQIVFVRGGDIWGVRPTGKGLHHVTRFRGAESEPSVAPNGRRLAFENAQAGGTAEVYVSTIRGRHPRWISKRLSKSGNWLSFHSPTWSPNGKRIAFVCNRFEYHGICTTSRRGGKAKVIYRCNCNVQEPDWGKGNRIVFVNGLSLWTVGGNGGHHHRLHIRHIDNQDSYGYEHPSWKPNGKTIAFQVGDANTAIDTVSAGGGNHRRLIQSNDFSSNPSDFGYPAWAPNGRKIALQVGGNGPRFGGLSKGLYLMNPNGKGLRKKSSAMQDQYAAPFWGTK